MDQEIGIRELQPGNECGTRFDATAYGHAAMPNACRLVTVKQFLAEIEGERVFLAHRKARVLGFVSIWMAEAFVHHLYVDPSCQRQVLVPRCWHMPPASQKEWN